jgi:dienelactone hydrolase
MKKAGANIDMVSYPGAMHGFTNPNADKFGMAGLKYDAAADQQSWDAMLKLFGAVLR